MYVCKFLIHRVATQLKIFWFIRGPENFFTPGCKVDIDPTSISGSTGEILGHPSVSPQICNSLYHFLGTPGYTEGCQWCHQKVAQCQPSIASFSVVHWSAPLLSLVHTKYCHSCKIVSTNHRLRSETHRGTALVWCKLASLTLSCYLHSFKTFTISLSSLKCGKLLLFPD